MLKINKPITTQQNMLLQKLFADYPKRDFSIDNFFDEEFGEMYVDNTENPKVARLDGPHGFIYFTGDATSDCADELMSTVENGAALILHNEQWVQLAKRVHNDNLTKHIRYSLSTKKLNIDHLEKLSANNPENYHVQMVDSKLATQILDSKVHWLLTPFKTAEDFMKRGIGACIYLDGELACFASSGGVCKRGVELQLITMSKFRQKGMATLVCAKLIKECLKKNLIPLWDADNDVSVRLAEKLGYELIDSYDTYDLNIKQDS